MLYCQFSTAEQSHHCHTSCYTVTLELLHSYKKCNSFLCALDRCFSRVVLWAKVRLHKEHLYGFSFRCTFLMCLCTELRPAKILLQYGHFLLEFSGELAVCCSPSPEIIDFFHPAMTVTFIEILEKRLHAYGNDGCFFFYNSRKPYVVPVLSNLTNFSE